MAAAGILGVGLAAVVAAAATLSAVLVIDEARNRNWLLCGNQ